MQPKDISSNHFSGEAGLLGEKSLLIYLVVGLAVALYIVASSIIGSSHADRKKLLQGASKAK